MSVTGISYNKNQDCFVLDCFNENVPRSQTSIHDLYNEGKIKGKIVTSKMYSKSCILILSIFIIGISCAVAFLSYSYFSHIWSKRYCDSPLCVRSAQNLIAAMNTSVDPCEDFYNFACGNFAQYKPLPKYNVRSDWFDIGTDLMLKNISNFLERNNSNSDPDPVLEARFLYEQCLRVAGQENETFDPIASVLRNIGLTALPPLLQASSNFSLLDTMVQSKLIYGKDYFVSFSTTMDPKNRTRYRLFLSKPSDAPPLPVHYNHILLYNLKKRQLEERENEDDELQNTEPGESSDTSDEVLSSEMGDEPNSTSEMDTYAAAFYDYASNVFEFAYNSSKVPWSTVSNATLEENVSNLMNTDILVDKLVITHFLKDSAHPIPVHMSVKNLQNFTNNLWPKNSTIPIIIWEDYFNQMFEDVPEVKLNFEDKNLDAEIVVKDLFYLSVILSWIAGQTTLQELEMYMWWTTVTTIAPYTSSKIRGYADDFLYLLKGIEPRPRNLHCAEIINSVYGMVTAYSLVDNAEKKNDIEKITEMVGNIQSTFKESMKKISWMDEETKKVTAEKLENMKTCVGYPPWLNDTEQLEMHYEDFREVALENSTFLENVLRLNQLIMLGERQNYRNEVNLEDEMWVFNPMDVNAYNWLEGNRITIPVGILQFPFYEQGLQALNYGSIGSIIGHELTHGFDNTGKEYDSKGEAHTWWTNETMKEFHERIKCFIDHYESFHEDESQEEPPEPIEPPEPTVWLSNSTNSSRESQYLNKGSRTLDENIADNGGLRNALYAYRNYILKYGSEPLLPQLKQYSSEQLFFLAFANTWCKTVYEEESYSKSTDEHSPNHVRVWGTLTNSKEFAEAWQCKKGTRMNPLKNKCEMW